MRISDWSSDVCSSDLHPLLPSVHFKRHLLLQDRAGPAGGFRARGGSLCRAPARGEGWRSDLQAGQLEAGGGAAERAKTRGRDGGSSEARRGGKVCVSTSRSRGSQYHKKKKKTK